MEYRSHNSRVLQSLSPGDRVQFHRFLYSHWGIYIGDGNIIHVSEDNEDKAAKVKIDNFWDVAGEDKASKNNGQDIEWSSLSAEQIIRRARSYVGNTEYDQLFDSCEHFVNWCRYDRVVRQQVDNFLTGVAIVGIGALTVGALAVGAAVGAAVYAATAKDEEQTENKKKKASSNQLLWEG
ncbi:hypothetical protein BsWGS_08808 [Bradybaena similaris]